MKFIETPLSGAFVIQLDPIQDMRGAFSRVFCAREFSSIGFHYPVAQINHSLTKQKGTVRGVHYQLPPAAEIKIIRCLSGSAFDVMVDLRAGSSTFMQWHGVELSHDNMCMAFIPEGFGHGFQALADNVELMYLHSAFYCPEYERGVRFDDQALAISWPLPVVAVSPKDRNYPPISPTFRGIEL